MSMVSAFVAATGHAVTAQYRHAGDGSTETVDVLLYGRSNDAPSGWRGDTASAMVPVLTGPDPRDGDRLEINGETWTVARPADDTGPTVRTLGLDQGWSLYVSRDRGTR